MQYGTGSSPTTGSPSSTTWRRDILRNTNFVFFVSLRHSRLTVGVERRTAWEFLAWCTMSEQNGTPQRQDIADEGNITFTTIGDADEVVPAEVAPSTGRAEHPNSRGRHSVPPSTHMSTREQRRAHDLLRQAERKREEAKQERETAEAKLEKANASFKEAEASFKEAKADLEKAQAKLEKKIEAKLEKTIALESLKRANNRCEIAHTDWQRAHAAEREAEQAVKDAKAEVDRLLAEGSAGRSSGNLMKGKGLLPA